MGGGCIGTPCMRSWFYADTTSARFAGTRREGTHICASPFHTHSYTHTPSHSTHENTHTHTPPPGCHDNRQIQMNINSFQISANSQGKVTQAVFRLEASLKAALPSPIGSRMIG